jgi:glc operon protein GlcG
MSDTISARTISLVGAQRVLAAAIEAATERGLRMCITVADISGEPVATARMDGAPRISAKIAADKAYTVTGFLGMPTKAWWGAIADDPALVHGITKTDRLIIFGGGVPIHEDGELVGSIGVSGGSAEQDAEVAEAGAAAFA